MHVDASAFYGTYHGHTNEDLQIVYEHLNQQHPAGLVYLAGDSSLDNKFWFHDTKQACNGYESVLRPPRSRMDVCWWLNKKIEDETKRYPDNPHDYGVINCAIEESTVGDRACGRMRAQDNFIQHHITRNDILIVSVGGNDIALKPNPCTIFNMLTLIKCSTMGCLKRASGTAFFTCNDCCCGCGFSCLNTCCGCPPGFGYFIHLFKVRIQDYVQRLVKFNKPKKVMVCMIYYIDEDPKAQSWANATLGALGYNSNPKKLQMLIRRMFMMATSQIKIPGTEVVGIPLFLALDGKNSSDYVARVEPSAKGGEPMADLLLRGIKEQAGDRGEGSIYDEFLKLDQVESGWGNDNGNYVVYGSDDIQR